MTDRHTVDTITSDALDALYEQLEAAEQTESQRQLATAREALASATLRAARAEAAIARVRAVHQPMARAGFTICSHCSGWNGVRCIGLVRDYPCDTIAALDEPTSAATQAIDDYEQTTGHQITCTAGFTSICDCTPKEQP